MKESLSAPGLGWKEYKKMCDDSNEPIYTDNGKNMRHFIRQSIKGGRVCDFIQYFKSKICGDVLKIIREELNMMEMFMILLMFI